MGINHELHTYGRVFWHSIRLQKKSPIFHRYPTHEVEQPYRWSNSLIFRLPWSERGLVVGWWQHVERDEAQAILAGMSGRRMDLDDFTDAERAQIRRNMIKRQFNAEQQETLIEVLDL